MSLQFFPFGSIGTIFETAANCIASDSNSSSLFLWIHLSLSTMLTSPTIQPNSPTEVLALQHVLDNVLGLPVKSEVRSAFPFFWISDINDHMSISAGEDLTQYYEHTSDSEDGTKSAQEYKELPPMLVRNIDLLQQWFLESQVPDINVWFTLNKSLFISWKCIHLLGISTLPVSSFTMVAWKLQL